ncbi:MAG: orotidine 5'-phosphate decarboxylase / HUMPS family protein [Candidatus Micrarchaeota archaeon]
MTNGLLIKGLSYPPYLQVALDMTDIDAAVRTITKLPRSNRLILEAGTPLIKSAGAKVVKELRKHSGCRFIVADLKTMDTGKLEADIAFEGGADAATASGCASIDTLERFISGCRDVDIYSIVDCMGVDNPVKKLASLEKLPDIINIHRGIDGEGENDHLWEKIKFMKARFRGALISVAGGITADSAPEALRAGADILVIGRYITNSRDSFGAAEEILKAMENSA